MLLIHSFGDSAVSFHCISTDIWSISLCYWPYSTSAEECLGSDQKISCQWEPRRQGRDSSQDSGYNYQALQFRQAHPRVQGFPLGPHFHRRQWETGSKEPQIPLGMYTITPLQYFQIFLFIFVVKCISNPNNSTTATVCQACRLSLSWKSRKSSLSAITPCAIKTKVKIKFQVLPQHLAGILVNDWYIFSWYHHRMMHGDFPTQKGFGFKTK